MQRSIEAYQSIHDKLTLFSKLSPDEISKIKPNSHKVVEWTCTNNHTWRAPVSRINRGAWCGYCDGQFATPGVNDLTTTHSEVAKDFIEEKRRLNTLMAGSNYLALWVCSTCTGSYRMSVQKATRAKTRCPYCGMRKLLKDFNDLETLYPDLAFELSKSNKLKASEILAGKSKTLLWFCEICNKDYERAIGQRANDDRGCPICKGKELINGYTDLESYSKVLASELMDLDPTTVHRFSNKVVLWRCSDCSFEWRTSVMKRTKRGDGCRNCSSSGPEKDFSLFLESLGVSFTQRDRSIIRPLELDFYMSELSLAVEFNGDYWHSDEMIAARGSFDSAAAYHAYKFDECAKKGVRLAYVWESDWRDRRAKVEKAIEEFIKNKTISPLLNKLSNSSVRYIHHEELGS